MEARAHVCRRRRRRAVRPQARSSISAASPTPMPTTIPAPRRRVTSPTRSCRSAITTARASRSRRCRPISAARGRCTAYAASYFGDPDAQYHLARLMLDGNGPNGSACRPRAGSMLAANKGQYQAQAVLGRLLFKGEPGCRASRRAGLMWLAVAHATAGAADAWIARASRVGAEAGHRRRARDRGRPAGALDEGQARVMVAACSCRRNRHARLRSQIQLDP